MSLPKRCVDMLLDLVNNKLTSIQVIDREDAREIVVLEQCKRELQTMADAGRRAGGVMPFTATSRVQPEAHRLTA